MPKDIKVYSEEITARWGIPLLDEGFAPVSQIFLNYYKYIPGIKDIDALFIIKATSGPPGKWLKDTDFNMICTDDTLSNIRRRLKDLKHDNEKLVEYDTFYKRDEKTGKISGIGTKYNFKKLWDAVYNFYEIDQIVRIVAFILQILPTLKFSGSGSTNNQPIRKNYGSGNQPIRKISGAEGDFTEAGVNFPGPGGKIPDTIKINNKIDFKIDNKSSKITKNYNDFFVSGHITYYCYDDSIHMCFANGDKKNKTPQQALSYLKDVYGEEYMLGYAAQSIKTIYNL